MHKQGMVTMAGDAAQRRFDPRSVRRHHGAGDREAVIDYALRCSGSSEQAELLIQLWAVQARELVQLRWPAVQHVAEALLTRGTLERDEVMREVMARE